MSATDNRSGVPSDASVIADALENPDRFAVIFDRHYGAIWSYLSRRVDRVLADELASETFVRAFAGRATYDPAHPDARAWLYGIATNLIRKHQRREERQRRAYARAAEPESSVGGLDEAVARVDAAVAGPAVAAALGRLQRVDREALLLLALTDLDYEGIAVATDVPVGTVRSRLHRARRRVRDDLQLTPIAEEPRNERTRA